MIISSRFAVPIGTFFFFNAFASAHRPDAADADADAYYDGQRSTPASRFLQQDFNFEVIESKSCNNPSTDSVEYDVTFLNLWTAQRHSFRFPSGGSEHWSPVVFASHNDDYQMWAEGEEATSGVERIAETGSTSELREELNAAENDGSLLDIVQAPGLRPPKERTSANGLTVDKQHPLVSAISMIAPSPDWFSGLYSLALYTPQDGWYESITVYVYPWDAGTEDGERYQLSNAATDPREAIRPFTAGNKEEELFVSKNSNSGNLQVLPVGQIELKLSSSTSCNFLVRVGGGKLKIKTCDAWVARRKAKRCRKKVRNADGTPSGIRARDLCRVCQ